MTVLVDDSTKPANNDAVNSPASEGAGELRAIKAKLNSLYLNTGVSADGPNLVSSNNSGFYAKITASAAGAGQSLYGFRSRVTRTGGVAAGNDTIGGRFEGVLSNNLASSGLVVGMSATAETSATNSSAILLGSFAGVISRYHANTGFLWGSTILFANRTNDGDAVTGGVGSNLYNNNSTALRIRSQPRSSSGEYCGWNNGIVFEEYSMDIANGQRGYAIDFAQLHIDPVGPPFDPATDYRVDGVIRMRAQQSIVFVDQPTAPTITGRIYVSGDGARPRLVFEVNGVERWGVDITNGNVYKNGVLQY